MNALGRDANLLCQLLLLLRRVRQELVQRRIQEANRCRVSLERAEDSCEVVALVRQQLRQCRLPFVERLGKDHLAHRIDAVAFEEHVLGSRQADADRAKSNGVGRLFGRIRIGPDRHPRGIRAPLHQLLKALELLGLLGRFVTVDQPGDDLRGRSLHLACVDLPCSAIDRHPVTFVEGLAVHRDLACLVVDFDGGRSADAHLAHLAGDERRM